MAMDRCRKRKVVSRMSPVTTDMRRPSSLRQVSASAHIGPKDTISIDMKKLLLLLLHVHNIYIYIYIIYDTCK